MVLVGCGGRTPAPTPAPAVDEAVYREVAAAHLARDGLRPRRIVVVTGGEWRAAADGAGSLAEALDRAAVPGVTVELWGRSPCVRSTAGGDCMFVSVVGADVGPHELDPRRLDAVVVAEPAPPDAAEVRMAWRAELRTGRLLLFVGPPQGQSTR